MPKLTLPARNPGTLRAFWLVISSIFGLVAGVLAAVARRDPRLLGVAAPIASLLALPGLRRPELVQLPYRAWNRLGRYSADAASTGVAAVGFLLLRATSRIGGGSATPPTSPPGFSGWMVRRSQPPAAYVHQDTLAISDRRRDAFDRYARQPGHEWAEALRPVIRLLAAIEKDNQHDDTPPTDVYTLY